MNKFYGKYAGVVFNNQDPDKRGRIKAYVPRLGFTTTGAGATDWALPVLSFPGEWFGPPAQSKVWIEFEGGDPSLPIWSGAFLGAPGGNSELPLRAQGTDDGTDAAKGADTFQDSTGATKNQPSAPFAGLYPFNNVMQFPNGILLEYDDTKGAERIMLFHPSGTFIEMMADGKCVIKTNDDFWKTIGNDLLEHVIANLFQNVGGNVDRVVGGNSTEKVTGNKEIDATQIKLGTGASLTVMLSTIINKYNTHTHSIPAGGSTGTPSTLFVQGTDDTTKTVAE